MGLDQYLNRKLYVSTYKPREDGSGDIFPNAHRLQLSGPGFESVTPSVVNEIRERAGYWRKANQIHKWFIDNCAGGVDDCRPVYVEHDKLRELLAVVNEVLDGIAFVPAEIENGRRCGPDTGGEWVAIMEPGQLVLNAEFAAERLPTADGFFFGNTDYNNYYIEDLKETKVILEAALDPKYDDWSYYYEASW